MADGIWEGSGPGRGGVSAAAQSRRVRAGLRNVVSAAAQSRRVRAGLRNVVSAGARPRRRAGLGCVVTAAAVAAVWLAPGARSAVASPRQSQPVTALAPVVLDGPSAPGAGPSALTSAIARDGTGALAYLKSVGGATHVFLSALEGGAFEPPVQVDGTLPGASSQPLVAAGAGGALVVAFLNGSSLYVAQRPSTGTALSAPSVLAYGAANPALAMSAFGKTYLAFTVPDGGGFDVRVAYRFAGGWSIESAPLNVNRGDDAGSGSGRPAITAAGDGVAIVAWGEDGHVFSRRVWGTTPSAVTEQADGPVPGCSEVWADEPAIGAGGDSSYASLALHETLVCGGATQSRVLVNRLHGSRYEGVWPADGPFGTAAQGADEPRVAVGEYGSGWVTSQAPSGDIAAMALSSNDVPGASAQLNTTSNASPADATPSMAGLYSSIVAWQHDPGAGATPDVRARYADANRVFGPELVLSVPGDGPADASAGLTVAGDVAGDAAVAWVQHTPAGDEVLADRLFRAPGAPAPTPQPGYLHTTRPTLAWAAAFEPWGSVSYAVSLDGQPLGQTGALALNVGAALAQGRHTWQVTATNQAGMTSGAGAGTFFIDTQPPVVAIALGSGRTAGQAVRLTVSASDHPPPLSAGASSGIASIVVHWGDGTVQTIGHRRTHVYRRPGRYRIRVVVRDRAGNATTKTIIVRIVAQSKKRASGRHPHA